MTKNMLALLLIFGTALSVALAAESYLARFEGGIGVIPVASAAGTQNVDGSFPNVLQNNVRGVPPAGRPWVIARLSADVGSSGQISVDGRGLLLAGGNNIGTNPGQMVQATLFCGSVMHQSGLVQPDAAGDFKIDDTLSPVPPDPCTSPVLLIVGSGGSWVAAGIPKH